MLVTRRGIIGHELLKMILTCMMFSTELLLVCKRFKCIILEYWLQDYFLFLCGDSRAKMVPPTNTMCFFDNSISWHSVVSYRGHDSSRKLLCQPEDGGLEMTPCQKEHTKADQACTEFRKHIEEISKRVHVIGRRFRFPMESRHFRFSAGLPEDGFHYDQMSESSFLRKIYEMHMKDNQTKHLKAYYTHMKNNLSGETHLQ